MKTCSKCNRLLPETEFYKTNKTKSGLKSWCKQCEYEDTMKRRERNRENSRESARRWYSKIKEYINQCKQPCAKCGETRQWVIQFHHVDPSTKKFVIGSGRNSKESIDEEIKKCVCLCSNCHDEFHYFYGHSPKEPVKSLEEYLS